MSSACVQSNRKHISLSPSRLPSDDGVSSPAHVSGVDDEFLVTSDNAIQAIR